MKPQLIPPERSLNDHDWANLFERESSYQDYELPKVTIVIPCYNCMQSISTTLESILAQHYPDFEVLVIDGASSDRTLEVIKSFRDHRLKILSVSNFHRYEIMNRGISQASGKYINFLFPGDFYINRNTLRIIMTFALNQEEPHLVYGGTLLRDGRSEVKILYNPLSLTRLKLGHQPTSLQSCWFSIDTFATLGKFDTKYQLRGGFDLLCRFCLHSNMKAVSLYRVLTDYDLRWVTRQAIFTHFKETMQIIYKYFGLLTTSKWLWHQKDTQRLMKSWIKNLRIAFLGK
jgi:glycosyltransferase involved in cell wall biosynthesis